jgi:hypothetical protein
VAVTNQNSEIQKITILIDAREYKQKMPEGTKQARAFLRHSLAEGSAKWHYAQY